MWLNIVNSLKYDMIMMSQSYYAIKVLWYCHIFQSSHIPLVYSLCTWYHAQLWSLLHSNQICTSSSCSTNNIRLPCLKKCMLLHMHSHNVLLEHNVQYVDKINQFNFAKGNEIHCTWLCHVHLVVDFYVN